LKPPPAAANRPPGPGPAGAISPARAQRRPNNPPIQAPLQAAIDRPAGSDLKEPKFRTLLKAQGVITDAEFAQQKAKLLA